VFATVIDLSAPLMKDAALRALQSRESLFSLSEPMLMDILEHAKPLGHNEAPDELNLGFGFVYYGLVRALRPAHVVVIGSGYGFSVVCLALGLKDNRRGRLTFIDPSYSVFRHGPFRTVGGLANWDDPDQVQVHFDRFDVATIVTHEKLTSSAFFAEYDGRENLPPIDLAFIDGSHAFADVREDFLNVMRYARRNSYVLLHDTNIYVREFVRHSGVKRWLRFLERYPEHFEIVDFPFASGVAIVRLLRSGAWEPGV
jgi:hypothetical protein